MQPVLWTKLSRSSLRSQMVHGVLLSQNQEACTGFLLCAQHYVRLVGKRGNQCTHHKKKTKARIHLHWVKSTKKPHWGTLLLYFAEYNAPHSLAERVGTPPPLPRCLRVPVSHLAPSGIWGEGASQSLGLLLPAQNQQSGKVLWLSRVYLLNKGCDRKRNGTGNLKRASRKWFPVRRENSWHWRERLWDTGHAPVSKHLSPIQNQLPNPLMKWKSTITPSQPISTPEAISQSISNERVNHCRKLIQNSSWVPDCPDDREWGGNKREKHQRNEKRVDFSEKVVNMQENITTVLLH